MSGTREFIVLRTVRKPRAVVMMKKSNLSKIRYMKTAIVSKNLSPKKLKFWIFEAFFVMRIRWFQKHGIFARCRAHCRRPNPVAGARPIAQNLPVLGNETS